VTCVRAVRCWRRKVESAGTPRAAARADGTVLPPGRPSYGFGTTLCVKNKKPASGDFSYKWQGTDRRGKE